MKRFSNIIAILLVLTVSAPAQSDLDEVVRLAKQTVEHGSAVFEKSLLLKGKGMFERVLAIDPENSLFQYHLAYAEYRLMTYFLNRERDNFGPVAGSAEERLEKILREEPNWSEAQALLSAVHGLQIAENWTRAVTLGPRANRLAEQATSNDPVNPRAWLLHGSQKLNTPKMFGGSVDDAIEAFEKSVELFEAESEHDPLAPTWGYADALVWLGIAYERMDRDEEARAVFHKVLSFEPEYRWVKHTLLPTLEEKIAERK
jgi:tetratricopeptide (TPR) repeat protein